MVSEVAANESKLDPRGGRNRRLSESIELMTIEYVLRRQDHGMHTDFMDIADAVMKFEKMHPALAVDPKFRRARPSPPLISELIERYGLSVQKTNLRKR